MGAQPRCHLCNPERPSENLALRWRNVELRGDATGRRDENRGLIAYTLPLF